MHRLSRDRLTAIIIVIISIFTIDIVIIIVDIVIIKHEQQINMNEDKCFNCI